jgi:hypothetical protein
MAARIEDFRKTFRIARAKLNIHEATGPVRYAMRQGP